MPDNTFSYNWDSYFANTQTSPFLTQSPLTEFKWRNLKRTGKEIEDLFFPSTKVSKLADKTVFKEADCDCGIESINYIIYWDDNRDNDYTEGKDRFLFRIKIFVSTDGLKIEQAYNECQPSDEEVFFFIENNLKDLSKQKLFAKFGGDKNKAAEHKEILKSMNKKPVWNFIKQKAEVSDEQMNELINKGFIEAPISVIGLLIDGVSYMLNGFSLLGKIVGWLCEKLGQGVLDYLSVPEDAWNTNSEDYFFKKENIINALQIKNDSTNTIKNSLLLVSALAGVSALPLPITTAILYKVTTSSESFINGYNAFVKDTIDAIYATEPEEGVGLLAFLQESVAFLCGVWNSLVDFVGGTLKFIGGLLSAPYEATNNYDHLFEAFDSFCETMQNFSLATIWTNLKNAFIKIKGYLQTEIKDYLSKPGEEGINSNKIAYAIGFAAGFIATFFIPFTQATKLANFSKIGKAILPAAFLEEMSAIGGKISSVSSVVNEAGKVIKDTYVDLLKRLQEILSLFQKGKEAVIKFFEDIWKGIAEWFVKRKDKIPMMLRAIEDGLFRSDLAKIIKLTDEIISEFSPFILEIEQKILTEEYEICAILTRKGEAIKDITSGLEGMVNYKNYIAKLFDAIVTHNHPNGSSLSPGDIISFIQYQMKEVRAVCPDGHIFVLKRNGLMKLTSDEIKKIDKAVETAMMPFLKEDKFTRLTKQADFYIEELQKMGNNRFEYIHYTP